MNNPTIYGVFDSKENINQWINGSNDNSQAMNLFFTGFDSFKASDEILLFCGELYNAEDLKKATGADFSNHAELLYALFKKEGYLGFKKINGKFTILIQTSSQTIVARDRYGLSSMFYYTDRVFSNHLHRLKEFKNTELNPDIDAIGTYLMYSYIPSPVTSFKNVSKLHGGHVLIKTSSESKIIDLFPFNEFVSNQIKIDEKEALIEYERLLKLSLKRRIGSHQKVGALLSGGYDSGGNISLLPEVFNGKIESYSIGFKDNPYSELPYARMMAERFGAEHHEYLMDGSEIEDLPLLVKNLGDPFSESGWMLNNSAMKLVHDKNLPIVLGGDGSDQLFTAHLREMGLRLKLEKKMLAPAQKLFAAFAENSLFEKDNFYFRARFQNDKIMNILYPDQFGFRKYQLKNLLKANIKPNPTLASFPSKFNGFEDLYRSVNYYTDINQISTEIILFKASRISQLYGVNMGFTYIDEDVLKFVTSLPLNLRAKGSLDDLASGRGVSKYLLKALIKPKLPTEVTSRKKQGGFSPLQIFFNDASKRELMYNFMLKSDVSKHLLDKKSLEGFFKSYDQSTKGEYWFWYKQTMANRLINVLVLSLWYESFVNNNHHDKLSEYLH